MIIRSKALRESLFFLAYALFFGGIPLIVFLTEPGATFANLVAAVLLGVPLFALSLHQLGRYGAIIVHPSRRRVIMVKGLFHRREFLERGYKDVASVKAVKTEGGSPGWEIQVRLKDGLLFRVQEPDESRAEAAAKELAEELGGKSA